MAANTLHASHTGVMRGDRNNTGVAGTSSELVIGDIRQGLVIVASVHAGMAATNIRQGLVGCGICPGLATGDIRQGLNHIAVKFAMHS